jgi:hypothetical protein
MDLTSPAFAEAGPIPVGHTGEDGDRSPPLRWRQVPAGTAAFALVMEDPDAPPGTWVHWVLYDIPGTARELPEAVERREELPDGSRHGLCWGVDRFERLGYHGPLPPPGPAHRYVFHLYALDQPLRLPSGRTARQVREAMASHVLAEATLTGLYAARRS